MRTEEFAQQCVLYRSESNVVEEQVDGEGDQNKYVVREDITKNDWDARGKVGGSEAGSPEYSGEDGSGDSGAEAAEHQECFPDEEVRTGGGRGSTCRGSRLQLFEGRRIFLFKADTNMVLIFAYFQKEKRKCHQCAG